VGEDIRDIRGNIPLPGPASAPGAPQWRSLAKTGAITLLLAVAGLIAYSLYAARLRERPEPVVDIPVARPVPATEPAVENAAPERLTPYSGRDFGMRSGFRPSLVVAGPFEPIAADVFTTETRAFALDGIEGPPASAICLGDGNRLWACGLQSRAALIGLIRDKEPMCQLVSGKPGSKPRDPGTGRWNCSVDGVDLALRLVEGGWARPTTRNESALLAALESARAARRGLWEGGWTIVRVPATAP